MCSALPGSACVNATHSSSALWEGGKPGNAMAGVCTMLVCTTLPDFRALWRGASGCSHAGEELSVWRSPCFPSTPRYFRFTDLVSAVNECLSLQREFTKPGRRFITNTQSQANPTGVTAALQKAVCWLYSHGRVQPLLTLTQRGAAVERKCGCQGCT